MSLTTMQYLLLNNLMYLEPTEGPFPKPEYFIRYTVGDWMRAFDLSRLMDLDPDCLPMTTAEEWREIINAVMKDPVLMGLKILVIYTDRSEGGGTCKNALFMNGKEEAVVVFKGTDVASGMAQWEDNFYSGNAAESPHQVNALDWYRRTYEMYHLERCAVTVTGHSKGGNKAKYITVLDPTVDRCVSFDGEGFSDKFFDKYRNEIKERCGKIENHMVNYDYISILLNDIGRETYYHGYNYGTGGFTENHLPNTFFRSGEDGDLVLDVDPRGRPEEMKSLDAFANSFLRSQEDEDRSASLKMFNAMLKAVLSIKKTMTRNEVGDLILDFAYDEENADRLAYLLAYFIRYQQKHPEVIGTIAAILIRFNLGSFLQYVDQLSGLINWKRGILWKSLYSGRIARTVNRLNKRAPEWVYAKLADHLKEKNGISLTPDQVRRTAQLIDMVDGYMQNIVINEDSRDRVITGENEK